MLYSVSERPINILRESRVPRENCTCTKFRARVCVFSWTLFLRQGCFCSLVSEFSKTYLRFEVVFALFQIIAHFHHVESVMQKALNKAKVIQGSS